MGFAIVGKPLAAALILLYVVSTNVGGYNVHDINALKKKLLTGYNKNTHPYEGKDVHSQKIWTEFSILAVGDLDESLEKLTTILELTIKWMDESLRWNMSENAKISNFTTNQDEVWRPEFFVYNHHYHVNYVSEEKRNLPIIHFSNGFTSHERKITTETSCDLDMSSFPFDTHTCKIEFVCNQFVQIIAEFKEGIIMYLEPDGSWDVYNATIEAKGNTVTISLSLARKPTFVLVNLIVPMTMLALLSPFVFLLPNQSGERVGFSITILLAISVFMTIVADNVPNKSHPFPLILTMFFISYSFTVAVVMIVIINARVYRIPDHVPVPRPLTVLHKIPKCLCYCFRRRSARGNITFDNGDNDETTALKETARSGKLSKKEKILTWKDISWGIDMFSMTFLFALKFTLVVAFYMILKRKQTV